MRTVIITGATRGLGYSLAGAFAHAGYRVGVLGRDLQTAKAACHRLKGEVWPIEADVRDAASLEDAAQDCRQRFGRLDVWIQNAGIVKDRSLIKMTDTEWQEVIDTNLTGAFYGIRAAARAMMRQKNGAILAIGSFVSLQGGYGNANYAASKAGLLALVKTAAREVGRFNVRVNALLPGFHATDIAAQMTEAEKDRLESGRVLPTAVRPQDVSAMAMALCENESMSGQVVSCDSRIL